MTRALEGAAFSGPLPEEFRVWQLCGGLNRSASPGDVLDQPALLGDWLLAFDSAARQVKAEAEARSRS